MAEYIYTAREKATNADRIRGMSDEELAVILESGCPCQEETDCDSVETIKGEEPYEHCRRCILKWLKSPVKGDE